MSKNVQTIPTIALISHASKVMLKILQPRFQQYVNREFPDVQAGFRKDGNQTSDCQHMLDHRERERYTQLNAEFQRIARDDKTFLN